MISVYEFSLMLPRYQNMFNNMAKSLCHEKSFDVHIVYLSFDVFSCINVALFLAADALLLKDMLIN